MLYDLNSATMLLGCFCHRPHLTLSEKYKIAENDFKCKGVEESQFYNIVYRVIYNLAVQGAGNIDGVAFDMFLQAYPDQQKMCQQYDHINFIDTIKQLAIPDNIELYYTTLRKYAMLREYKANGFDVSAIYDELKDEASQKKKLLGYSISDIAEHFSSIQTEVKQKYVASEGIQHHNVGDGLSDNIDIFKTTPSLGLAFQNTYLNRIFGGMNGLVLRSADQGSGKSMLMVADACVSSCEEVYSDVAQKYVPNPSYCGNVLFINSELQFERQLQPMFASFVSNVERRKIRWGDYDTPSEEQRARDAEEILRAHTYAVDMPDFTISKLEETIAYYVERYDIKMCVFDYVSFNQHLSAELARESKVNIREDMALLELTRRLKEMSLYYDIPILSGTQTSRASREKPNVDATWLAGGLSQLHKADSAMIIKSISKKDLTELEPMEGEIQKIGLEPTHCIHMLKGRDSSYPDLIKVYSHIDLGTGRDTPLFCLNKDGDEVINIKPLQIKR